MNATINPFHNYNLFIFSLILLFLSIILTNKSLRYLLRFISILLLIFFLYNQYLILLNKERKNTNTKTIIANNVFCFLTAFFIIFVVCYTIF
mgnify:CR=1 FL=1